MPGTFHLLRGCVTSYAYYRFFPGDYIRDTIHLGWLEDCAYRRLIDLYQLHSKPIRNDRAYILRAIRAIEPEQQAAADTVLAEFFTLKADGWHQIRCDAEIRYRTALSEQGKRAVKAREIKRLQTPDDQPIISGSSNQNQNHRSTTPLAAFTEFWKLWPPGHFRKESKGKCETLWKQKNLEAKAPEILAHVRALLVSDHWRDPQFIPAPLVYLNKERWDGAEAPVKPVKKVAL